MSVSERQPDHLDPGAIAGFLDHALTDDQRARTEAHLAECRECREELVEVQRLVQSPPRRRWAPLVPLVAAAAVLLLIWSGGGSRHSVDPLTRDPALTATLAPQPLAPLGTVAQVARLQWTAVPGVLHYRLTLFSGEGRAVWQTTTTDTSVTPPDSVHLVTSAPYYWQIKAETSYGRWVESELVAFTLAPPVAPR